MRGPRPTAGPPWRSDPEVSRRRRDTGEQERPPSAIRCKTPSSSKAEDERTPGSIYRLHRPIGGDVVPRCTDRTGWQAAYISPASINTPAGGGRAGLGPLGGPRRSSGRCPGSSAWARKPDVCGGAAGGPGAVLLVAFYAVPGLSSADDHVHGNRGAGLAAGGTFPSGVSALRWLSARDRGGRPTAPRCAVVGRGAGHPVLPLDWRSRSWRDGSS
jgi:hypothetical protein